MRLRLPKPPQIVFVATGTTCAANLLPSPLSSLPLLTSSATLYARGLTHPAWTVKLASLLALARICRLATDEALAETSARSNSAVSVFIEAAGRGMGTGKFWRVRRAEAGLLVEIARRGVGGVGGGAGNGRANLRAEKERIVELARVGMGDKEGEVQREAEKVMGIVGLEWG